MSGRNKQSLPPVNLPASFRSTPLHTLLPFSLRVESRGCRWLASTLNPRPEFGDGPQLQLHHLSFAAPVNPLSRLPP